MLKTADRIPTLETRRLLLQPLALDDAPAIQNLFPHWEIVRHLGDRIPWPYPDDGALIFVRDIALPAMTQGTQWHWSLRLKTDPTQLIGLISRRDDPQENRGFWLGLPWQGRGLMAEATEPVTDFWFDDLGRSVLRVPKAVANPRIAPHLRKQRHAHGPARDARVCRWFPALGALGDHRGGMADPSGRLVTDGPCCAARAGAK